MSVYISEHVLTNHVKGGGGGDGRGPGRAWGCSLSAGSEGQPKVLLTRRRRRAEPLGSAELEARGALDGVQQLAAQQRLVGELGELQQVHARAGRGEPLQV